ncbi:MAG: hypothetical protein J6O61_03865 [Butyrivibrio sp.]|uniref:hypothetical protein n=1 Tax=Butyrivibrio sp. TaxID=28121 RepID=UPI001B054BD0|nr:hypothetical protein [Butyrivibrio sp.]MBO6239965.1 hypothetical protein [Butyrivibrio sp.]
MNQNEQNKQIRIKYAELLNRLWDDPELLKKFQDNPEEVLKEAGIPTIPGAKYHIVAPEDMKPITETDIYLPYTPKPDSQELMDETLASITGGDCVYTEQNIVFHFHTVTETEAVATTTATMTAEVVAAVVAVAVVV